MPKMTLTRGVVDNTVRLLVPLDDYTKADVVQLIADLQQVVDDMQEIAPKTVRWEITYKGNNYPDVIDWADMAASAISQHVSAKLRERPHHTHAIARDTQTGQRITITKVA